MTWFRDLAACEYFDWPGQVLSESDRLLAVGWLSAWHDYTRATVDPDVRAKLVRMLECPWSPFVFMGSHLCELCVGAGGYRQDYLASRRTLADGTQNLFIPAGHAVYVVPELVIHYIDEHGYAPPDEFCDAVKACPPIWSDEYFAELRQSGSATFNRIVPPPVYPADDRPLPSYQARMLKGVRLAISAIADAARHRHFDQQVAREIARVVPKIVSGGIEIVSIRWLDGYAEMMVRSHDEHRDPVAICRRKAPDIRPRITEDVMGSPRMIEFVPWRGDPRHDIERALAPARVDYIGLDPVEGQAKVFLVDDRPPTDTQGRHPQIAVEKPSCGNWVVDIIPRRPAL